MSLVTRPYIFDLVPGTSLVECLLDAGYDVFLLDWGIPDAADSQNTLDTYCTEYLGHAVDQVLAASHSQGTTIFGYCLGGVLSLLFAAGDDERRVRKLVLLATPVDFSTFGLISTVIGKSRLDIEALFDETGNVPATTMLAGLKLLQPASDIAALATLWLRMHDPDYLRSYQALTGWARDHVPFPGAAFADMMRLFVERACLLAGSVPLGRRVVRLEDVCCPVLAVTGGRDHLVPASSSGPLARVLINAPVDHLRVDAGHTGVFVGRQAQSRHIPAMIDWLEPQNP